MRGAFRVGVMGVVVGVALGCAPSAEAKPGERPPNIVLITTDDQPLSTFQRQHMPQTFRRLVDRGTNFTDAVVNTPLCCPSRATLLTGQYVHNHGVWTNLPGYGSLVDHRDVLPVWLRRAGYRTGHFGKWLHGYEAVRGTKPAPGWGRWHTQLDRRRYYDYKLSRDGRAIFKGSRPRDHLTPVMTRAAARWVKQNVERRRPLFVQLDYYAPHVGPRFSDGVGMSRCIGAPEPSPRDRRTVLEGGAPRPPSFNEADISDKPVFSRGPLLDATQIESLDRRYRCTLESMAGVDRGINRTFQMFQRAGALRNTAFIFLTDNGFLFGEHRIRGGKARPWEEAIRTPLVIRPPRDFGPFSAEVAEQAAEVDVVPTILRFARARPCRNGSCRTLDGHSLTAAMKGRVRPLRNRAVLVEMADRGRQPRSFACRFQALRISGSVFIENQSVPAEDTRICEDRIVYEHYEIATDPFQLENQVGTTGLPVTPRQRALRDRLDRLRACSGLSGRDPAKPGGFCE
jgi:N-acetylglucosamine-6-sulfatase